MNTNVGGKKTKDGNNNNKKQEMLNQKPQKYFLFLAGKSDSVCIIAHVECVMKFLLIIHRVFECCGVLSI